MSGENTLTSLNTMFKYVQDKAHELLPDNSVLMKLIPELTEATKEGRKYLVPVQLSHENGYTYGDGTVFALNGASNAVYSEIQVDANPTVLLTQISESVANRMANDKKTFITEATMRAKAMYSGAARRLEISMLYGQSATGLGTASSSTNVDATHTAVTFSAATWAPGIWSGAVGAVTQCYNGTTLVSSAADALFTVQKVDVENRKVTFTGTATGITALDSAIASLGRYFVFQGSGGSTSNDMLGLDYQIVGATSYLNIDPTIYPLWQGCTHDCGSASLNMSKVLAGMAKPVAKGGLDEDVYLMCSAATYANLNADQSALREYDGSYSGTKAENGSEGIVYRGPNGKITVLINNIVKEGEAFAFPTSQIVRVGAKDLTFKRPGKEDEFFQEIPNYGGYSLRCGAEFTVLIKSPAKCVKFTAIVNS